MDGGEPELRSGRPELLLQQLRRQLREVRQALHLGRYVAAFARGVCPEGWHLPSSSEWSKLYKTVGPHYAIQAKGVAAWPDATDAYGFSALPAGYYYDGGFSRVGAVAYIWSSTDYNSIYAYFWYLDAGGASVGISNFGKDCGFSVRCLKDEETP